MGPQDENKKKVMHDLHKSHGVARVLGPKTGLVFRAFEEVAACGEPAGRFRQSGNISLVRDAMNVAVANISPSGELTRSWNECNTIVDPDNFMETLKSTHDKCHFVNAVLSNYAPCKEVNHHLVDAVGNEHHDEDMRLWLVSQALKQISVIHRARLREILRLIHIAAEAEDAAKAKAMSADEAPGQRGDRHTIYQMLCSTVLGVNDASDATLAASVERNRMEVIAFLVAHRERLLPAVGLCLDIPKPDLKPSEGANEENFEVENTQGNKEQCGFFRGILRNAGNKAVEGANPRKRSADESCGQPTTGPKKKERRRSVASVSSSATGAKKERRRSVVTSVLASIKK